MDVVIFQRSITYIIIAMFNVVLTPQTKDVEFGKNLSIICKAEHTCTVNSWSVKEQNGTYETVVRESISFNRSKYGARLSKMERMTIYELIIYRLDRNDVHNDYRCECDTHSGYITDMHDKLTFMKDAKGTKDSSRNTVGHILLVICGIIVILSIIAFLLYKLLTTRNKHCKNIMM